MFFLFPYLVYVKNKIKSGYKMATLDLFCRLWVYFLEKGTVLLKIGTVLRTFGTVFGRIGTVLLKIGTVFGNLVPFLPILGTVFPKIGLFSRLLDHFCILDLPIC